MSVGPSPLSISSCNDGVSDEVPLCTYSIFTS